MILANRLYVTHKLIDQRSAEYFVKILSDNSIIDLVNLSLSTGYIYGCLKEFDVIPNIKGLGNNHNKKELQTNIKFHFTTEKTSNYPHYEL